MAKLGWRERWLREATEAEREMPMLLVAVGVVVDGRVMGVKSWFESCWSC